MSLENTGSRSSPRTPTESPGRLLAAVREAHSISPADLAIRLRLEKKIIKALERDDFENLPEPIFIKGYICSIAKQFDVDPAPILEAYAANASSEPPTLADFSSRAPAQIGVSSTIIKVVTYVLIATMVLLIGLWWRSNYQNDETRNAPASGDEVHPNVPTSSPLPYSFRIVEHDDDGWRIKRSVAAPEIDDTGSETGPSTAGSLIIRTTSEAWVEVYDAVGGKLYYGLAKAPDAVEIAGQSYYRLVLGNAESITLLFNGEKIDLGPHSRQGIARLGLGDAVPGDNEPQ